MKYILTTILTASIFIGGFLFLKDFDKTSPPVLGGVQDGQAYSSVFRAQNQSGNLNFIKSTSGVLGNVIINGAAAGVINFYDASTTNAGIRYPQATSSLVLLASIPANAAAGTFIYNVVFTNGLITEIIGTTPTTTITYR